MMDSFSSSMIVSRPPMSVAVSNQPPYATCPACTVTYHQIQQIYLRAVPSRVQLDFRIHSGPSPQAEVLLSWSHCRHHNQVHLFYSCSFAPNALSPDVWLARVFLYRGRRCC